MDALELLDYDCWRLVFRKLNADDLLNNRLVCRPFSHLLDEFEFQRKWKFNLITQFLIPYLKSTTASNPWKNLQSFRLVCKCWKGLIEKYGSKVYEPKYTFSPQRNLPLATCFFTADQIKDFRQKFGECKTNPFPSRIVYFGLNVKDVGREYDEYFYSEMASLFVKQFGRNIVNLHLMLTFHEYPGCLITYNLIRRISIHLPNLQTFILRCDSGLNKKALPFIQEKPLGDLPQLRTLLIDQLEDTVANCMVDKYAPQLTHFEIGEVSSEKNCKPVQTYRFQRLEKLSLTVLDLNPLKNLQHLESPLNFLKLTLFSDIHTWYVDKALRNVKHLPLDCLKIRVHQDVIVAEAGLQLKEYIHDKIQKLNIQIDGKHCKISFNFLLALPKLKELELHFSPRMEISHPQKLPEVVKLNDYLGIGASGSGWEQLEPYHSNVWEKVPSLKTLTQVIKWEREDGSYCVISKSTYSREKYEKTKKNMKNWLRSKLNQNS